MAWVYSTAAGPSKEGGDVHYLSVCRRCVLSRVALADVSGHGAAVASFAAHLSVLMERHLHEIKQLPLMSDLSSAVRQALGSEHYATMVAMAWHGNWSVVSFSNAGHPAPLWFSSSRREWIWLESGCAPLSTHLLDLPLGLLDGSSYDALALKSKPGDFFMLYSDGISEALDPNGNELGRHGLMNLVQSLDRTSAEQFGSQLVTAIDGFRAGAAPLDDQTVIVIKRNDDRE